MSRSPSGVGGIQEAELGLVLEPHCPQPPPTSSGGRIINPGSEKLGFMHSGTQVPPCGMRGGLKEGKLILSEGAPCRGHSEHLKCSHSPRWP